MSDEINTREQRLQALRLQAQTARAYFNNHAMTAGELKDMQCLEKIEFLLSEIERLQTLVNAWDATSGSKVERLEADIERLRTVIVEQQIKIDRLEKLLGPMRMGSLRYFGEVPM